MFVPVWTSRQVRTADCYLIVTARRRLSRNRFLLSSVFMSDLAWRKTEQAHQPIGSVGSNRLDQSEASDEQAHRPIRSVGRTSASTNRKRCANKRIDQSEASGEQSPRPIRSIRPGQLTRSNQSSRVHPRSHDALLSQSESKNPQDRMVKIEESTRSDGQNRRIYKIGWSESYRPIISLEQLFHRYIMVTFFQESTRSDGQNRIGQ